VSHKNYSVINTGYFLWKRKDGQRRNQELEESYLEPQKIIHRKGLEPNQGTEITTNQ